MTEPRLANYGRPYSPQDRRRAIRLRHKKHYDDIAELLGRTPSGLRWLYVQEDRIKRHATESPGLDTSTERLVKEGYRARVAGQSIDDCPHQGMRHGCAWKAGWHDADIEIGSE